MDSVKKKYIYIFVINIHLGEDSSLSFPSKPPAHLKDSAASLDLRVRGCFLREWEGLQTDGAELLRVTVAEPDLVCPEAKRLPEGSST